jgi:tetratricopeptide (TPR) repeat protein
MNRRMIAIFFLLILPGLALACMWDYDTLTMERARFPSTLELITGKFLRHSPEFYEWRIRDRKAKLEKDPDNPAYLDDMAVAYDKTEHDDKAIELMLRKEKVHPGLYETAANLGTFYLHSGQTDKGIEQLEKAIKINPDAHFGREKYQLRLAKYLKAQKSAKPVDLKKFDARESCIETFQALCGDDPKDSERRDGAVKGVSGMMKFGKHDSPILLRVLGDLLLVDNQGSVISDGHQDAKHLAARAYLKASYEPNAPKSLCELKAKHAIQPQVITGLPEGASSEAKLAVVEPQFREELAEAAAWYEDLRKKEIGWIQEGKNPEAEFDKLYASEPTISGPVHLHETKVHPPSLLEQYPLAATFCVVTLILIIGAVYWLTLQLFRAIFPWARKNLD